MAAGPDPDTTLFLHHEFQAPPERVFAAFLDAETLKKIWSAPEYTIVEMELDPVVGKGWRMVMRDEASRATARCTARFVAIEPPRRIVWLTRWLDGPLAQAPEARVTLDFRPVAGGTRVELQHEFFPDSATRDHHRGGWSAGMERLAELLARPKASR
jgi:uncharacterized protein YndB with AHSA1/START domain